MTTFFLFGRLPTELRYEIYQLATPPRVVEVTSVEEDEEDFWVRWITDPTTGLHMHPDIAYYLKFWTNTDLGNGQRWRKQSTLTSYGFSTTKPRRGHWVAEDHFPLEAILSRKKGTVYSMFRNSELYSSTPFPVLLHTCAESRVALMSMGYELAFSTRTHDARTWFNFRTDILYISGDMEYDYGTFLGDANSDAPVGQFCPQDLRRIRHLVSSRNFQAYFPKTQVDRLLDLCYLLPSLEHIYLDAEAWGYDTEVPDPRAILQPFLGAVAKLPQPRSWNIHHMMSYEDVDSICSIPSYCPFRLPEEPYSGHLSMDTWSMIWREAHGHGSSFIRAFEARMRALLQGRIDHQGLATATQHDIACGRRLEMRDAPRISAVHIEPLGDLQEVYYLRQALFLYAKAAVERLSPEQKEEHARLDQPATSGGTPLSWSETLRAEMAPLGHEPDWETRLEWWVKKGLPHLQCPDFDVFP